MSTFEIEIDGPNEASHPPPPSSVKLWALAAFGYVAPWMVGFASLLVVAALVAIPFRLGGHFLRLALLWYLPAAIARAVIVLRELVWRSPDRETGWQLLPRDSPRLFAQIADIANRLKVPVPDVVLIDEGYGGSIVQPPRLGGWRRSEVTMKLGFYLLACGTVMDVKSVIAHELGHLRHDKFRLNFYGHQIQMSWHRMVHAFGIRHDRISRMMARFGEHFYEVFSLHLSASCRAREMTADESSVRVTSPFDSAATLIRVAVLAEIGRSHAWPKVWAESIQRGSLSGDIAAEVVKCLQDSWQPKYVCPVLCEILREREDLSDYHPPIVARLVAMGVRKVEVDWCDHGALEQLLPSVTLRQLGAKMQQYYENTFGLAWQKARQNFLVQAARLEVLERVLSSCRPMSQHVAENCIARTTDVGHQEDAEVARELLRKVTTLQRAEERVALLMDMGQKTKAAKAARELFDRGGPNSFSPELIGRALLENDDAAGVELVSHWVRKDALGPLSKASEALLGFLRRQERLSEATEHESLIASANDLFKRITDERSKYSVAPVYEPHCCSPEQLDSLRQLLADRFPRIRKGYIVRQPVELLVGQPFHLVVCEPRWWAWNTQKAMADLEKEMNESRDNPLSFAFVCPVGHGAFLKIIKRVKESHFYRQKRRIWSLKSAEKGVTLEA